MPASLLRNLAILLIAALQLAVVGTAWVMADADAELAAPRLGLSPVLGRGSFSRRSTCPRGSTTTSCRSCLPNGG